MRRGLKLMMLAGSAEARQIAAWAQGAGAEVRAMVSEPPRGSPPMPVPCTLQDFTDVETVIEAMRGANAVVDASHAFDAAMSTLGLEAAQRLGLPFVAYRRPLWGDLDRIGSIRDAMHGIGPQARVFCATGWASLAEWQGFPGSRLFLRQTTRHDRSPPYDFVRPVFGTPPFTVAREKALFERLRIDTLVCRNLGGAASRAKVDAAQVHGARVLLLDPPPLPATIMASGAVTSTVNEVLDWVSRQ